MTTQPESTPRNEGVAGVRGAPEQVFGQRLRDLRTARGWSQQQVADAMGELGFNWRQTTAAKTEAAERPVPVGEVVALAGLFGVGVHDLLDVQQAPTTEVSALLLDYLGAQRRLDRAERQVEAARAALAEAQQRYDRARGVTDDGEHPQEA